ncbi:hypothetical protein BH18ACT17_BH18ACT17_02190 [soil metagenome]
MTSTEEALEAVFARWARRERAPGLAWGLVRAGELVAHGGVGTSRVGERAVPDTDTVFRIASMTKSFTGAALMTSVAGGRLRLDDPVAEHVPEIGGWRGPTTDGPALTVRHLLSMEAGLPTDDPWADRHVDLAPQAMDELIEAGASFAWPPGVRFEYSNLGWGLVGRLIERVAGARPQEVVSTSLLAPLGMAATTWVRPVPPAAVAEPYRLQDGEWLHEVEPLGDGTIAPMGGLWSTVRDLACWVGFFTDAFPARDAADDGPLARWARREMQQMRRVDELLRFRPSPAGPSRVAATGYGIGLSVRLDERLGVSVGHSGGLPGYGSHMRWLPEHGVGVVGLSNVTYGNMAAACVEALEVLADRDELGPAHAVEAAPAFADAAESAVALLASWNDADADAVLADNAALDEPYDRRANEAARLLERQGRLDGGSLTPETPMRGAYATADGLVRVELGLNHERKLQWLDAEDRSKPSDDPIVVDEAKLRAVAGTAYVVMRPVGDLADAFSRWQGEVLDRLGGAPTVAPGAHATLHAFGSSKTPPTSADERAIVEATRRWAAAQSPLEMRAERLDVFEDESVPVVRLVRTGALGDALRDLWTRAEREGLGPGTGDRIGADAWVPHLSLAYPREVDPAIRTQLVTWVRLVDTGGITCMATEVEVVAYDGSDERRLVTFRLGEGST